MISTAAALQSAADWLEARRELLRGPARDPMNPQARLAAALSDALSALAHRHPAELAAGAEPDQAASTAFAEAAARPNPNGGAAHEPAGASVTALKRQLQDIRTALDRAAACSTDIPDHLHALSRRLDEFMEREGSAGIRRLNERLAHLSEQLVVLAAGTGEATAAAAERLNERLAGLDHHLAALASELATPTRVLAEHLEQRLSDVLEHVDAVGTVSATPVLALTQRFEERMSGLDRTVATLASELATPLESLGETLDERLARLAEPIQTLSDRVDTRLADLVEPIQALSDRLDARLAALEVAANGAIDGKALAERVSRQLADLTVQIADLAEGTRPVDAISGHVERLVDEVGALSRQVAEGANPMIEGLAHVVRDVQASSTPWFERLNETTERLLEAGAGTGSLLERLDRLEDVLRQVSEQADTAPLELMIRSLQERFDAVSTGFAPEGLEERLALLQSLNLTAAEPVQQALTETLTHVRGLRGEAAIIAERAAKAALRDMPLASAADVDGVREGFAELKALHAGAERRTQATLKAIQAALESLATRLPPGDARPESVPSWDPEALALRLDTAGRKLRAVAGTPAADRATPDTAEAAAELEEVLLDPSTPRSLPTSSGPSFATPPDGEPGSVRASFIAAARRAAQPSAEGAPPDAEPEAADAGPTTGHTLLERIRQTFDGHRRPLLLGLALLSVAAGSAPVGSRPGEMSKGALEKQASATAPANADASSHAPG